MKLSMTVHTAAEWDEVATEAVVEFDSGLITQLDQARTYFRSVDNRAKLAKTLDHGINMLVNELVFMFPIHWYAPCDWSRGDEPLCSPGDQMNHALVPMVPVDHPEASTLDQLAVDQSGFYFKAVYAGTTVSMTSCWVTWEELEEYKTYWNEHGKKESTA